MRRFWPTALILLAACGDGTLEHDAGVFRRDSGVPRDGGTGGGDGGTGATTILAQFVIDGDTVTVAAGSMVRTPDGRAMTGEHIRLLGIDAPEIAHPERMPPEDADCWGPEAQSRARELMQGHVIELSYDLSCQTPINPNNAEQCGLRDAFGRILAYVSVQDGLVVNEEMIRGGHAFSFRRYTHRFSDRYNSLEDQARASRAGMWGSCP
jgi:endonuclease YncB( thermonuclease family)